MAATICKTSILAARRAGSEASMCRGEQVQRQRRKRRPASVTYRIVGLIYFFLNMITMISQFAVCGGLVSDVIRFEDVTGEGVHIKSKVLRVLLFTHSSLRSYSLIPAFCLQNSPPGSMLCRLRRLRRQIGLRQLYPGDPGRISGSRSDRAHPM